MAHTVLSNRTIDAARMHQLRVLTMIVEQGSMTAAAKALRVSKSVVSGHLRRLEDELGVRLLERTTRQMALTEVGQQVHDAAVRMVQAGEEALAAVERDVGQVTGLLRVACPIDLGPVLIRPVVGRLRHAHPGLRIEVLLGDAPVDLIRARIDVAVRLGMPADSGFIMRRLGTVDEVVLACPGLAERWDHASSPRDLLRAPWIGNVVVEQEQTRFFEIESGAEQAIRWPPPAIATGSTDFMRCMAVEGHGFVVLPELLAGSDLAAGRLTRVLAPWIRRRVDLYTLVPSRTRSRKRAVFIDTLVEVLREQSSLGMPGPAR